MPADDSQMTRSEARRLRWTGTDSRGVARTGVTLDVPARCAEGKFTSGYKSARIYDGNAEVGGVGYSAEARKRIWWGER